MKFNLGKLITKWHNKFLYFLCGTESAGKVNRTVFWTMLSTISTILLLLFAYFQLQEIKETTSAEFAHKIKNDLYTPENLRLISLFDDGLLLFKSDTDDYACFELDTVKYKKYHNLSNFQKVPINYDIFEVDELLQSFEDLSFYEKKHLIKIEYIYDAYAYYIESLWENPQIAKYIKWQRKIPHNSNSYYNLEQIYIRLKDITDGEK
jgi:hypothetical protein